MSETHLIEDEHRMAQPMLEANIASELQRMAAEHPRMPAVITPQGYDARGKRCYTIDSFAELERRSRDMAIALQRFGIRQGMRCVLMVPPGVDLFALCFALFRLGAVPVLVDPGMGTNNLRTCLREAEPEAFIGVARAQLARLLFGWGKPSLRIVISTGRRWLWGGFSLPQALAHVHANSSWEPARVQAEDMAAILFTSGSTGVPKGVIYTHANFMAQVRALRQLYDIRPGEVDLPTFPLFALFAPALGMTAVIPDMDFTRPAEVDPENLLEAIEDFSVRSMFGSPALIRRLAEYGTRNGIMLPTLRRVISAGAPVPADVLASFSPMLHEDCQVYTPYGATEALPVCSIEHREILGETAEKTARGLGICVGRPAPGIELRIVRILDEAIPNWSDELCLPDGEIGEIVVRGAQVTRGYFHRNEATSLAKIADGEGFWHRMGDLGWRDAQGRIWFCGRKAHRVRTEHGELFTIPCEGIFNTHPKVFRSALVGVPKGEAEIPVVCIELHAQASTLEQAQIRRELLSLAARYEITANIDIVLFHPGFPVDVRHNAKIFREQLAQWASEVLS